MLVIPNEHVETINNLPELSAHVFEIGMRLARAFPEVVSNTSCTYLMHEGFEGLHVHLHLIPRHSNDDVQEGQRAPETAREELDRIGAQLQSAYERTWP